VRARERVTDAVQSSFLRRSAPMTSTWTQSLRSSPLSLLWWLRWQLYCVRPEIRAKTRQRRKTLRYRRTPADECPRRPDDWWPWWLSSLLSSSSDSSCSRSGSARSPPWC